MAAVAMRSERGTRIVSGTGLEVMASHQANNLASFCLNPENLSAAEFKSSGLICLAEEFQDRIVFKLC